MTTAAVVSTQPSETDLELAQRHRYGDREAFDEVYERFATMVYNLALRMSGNEADAADCTQETFLRIHRHLGSFRGRSELKTWVFRIAVNCCRSRLRRRATRKRYLDFGREELIAATADWRRDPERRAAARELAGAVQRMLGELTPAFREAVVLRDLHGLTYQEISEVLDVRIGTVRSRIARGREKLRQILESAS